MFCSNCGKQLAPTDTVCPACGTPRSIPAPYFPPAPDPVPFPVAPPMNVSYNYAPVGDSYFDGGLGSLIGWSLLTGLISALTFGICAPWGICMMYRWEIQHTVVDGRRLEFTGTALSLFANWIKWLFLTIITLGIYGFWVNIEIRKWKAANTHFSTM